MSTYSSETAADPVLVGLRDRVALEFRTGIPNTFTEIELLLRDGSKLTARHDSGVPETDVEAQGRRLEAKFAGLVDPLFGTERTAALIAGVADIENLDTIAQLTRLTCA
jgi:hypothetical protein